MSKNKLWDKSVSELLIILCILCMTAAFGASWLGFYSKRAVLPDLRQTEWIIMVLFALHYRFLAHVYRAYKISVSTIAEMIYAQVLSLSITFVLMYLLFVLLCGGLQPVLPLAVSFVTSVLVAGAWSLITHKIYFATHKPKRTIVVWDVRKGLSELFGLYGHTNRYNIVEKVHVKECLKDIPAYLNGYDAVFLSGVHSRDRNKLIKYCVYNDIDAYIIPRVGDMIMSAARPLYLFHLPMVKLERYSPSIWFLLLKRIGDILVSVIALILLSPIMIIVAIIIKATDGGSVFYKQRRLTLNGREFDVLKFRSMRMDAEKDGVARLSTGANDDRITPIGRFIRAVRIDELPQLINILKGEMSIVGPRPERPEIFEQYMKEMPEFGLRLQAKAGLTGLAQVNGRYNTSPYDKLLMDLSYIASPSLANDFIICLATVKILFLPESTEGIAAGATTAMDNPEDKSQP